MAKRKKKLGKKLKRCPLCGGKAALEKRRDSFGDRFWAVCCVAEPEWCSAQVVAWTKRNAVEQWNQRKGGGE